MSSYLEAFSKWFKLKIYQLEVTMSVYIFTPIEKFIFCTFSSLPPSHGMVSLPSTPITKDYPHFYLFPRETQ